MAKYDQEHHKLAFEIYRRTKNMKEVSRTVGCSYLIAHSWKAAHKCRFGCPYHDWDNLILQEQQTLEARQACIERGEMDPIEHEKAMTDALANKSVQTSIAIREMVRSDRERAVQWEYLWGLIYFQATGIPLDFDTLRLKNSGEDASDAMKLALEEMYSKSLKVTSLDGAIRALQTVQAQIDQLNGRDTTESSKAREVEVEEAEKVVGIKELRKLKSLLDTATPEQIQEALREANES